MRLSTEKLQEINNYKAKRGKAYFSQRSTRDPQLSARIQMMFDTIAEDSLSPFYHFALNTLTAGDYLHEDIMDNVVVSIYYYVRQELNLPITQLLKDQRKYEEKYIFNMHTLFEILIKEVVDIGKVRHMERVFNKIPIEDLAQTLVYALTEQGTQKIRTIRGNELQGFVDQLYTLPTEHVDTRVIGRLSELAGLLCATKESPTQVKTTESSTQTKTTESPTRVKTTEQLKAQKAVDDFKAQFLAAYNAKNK